jgi:hypothetical protein
MYKICKDNNGSLCENNYRIVDLGTHCDIGMVIPYRKEVLDREWDRTIALMDAAPDLMRALHGLMDAYANELGIPIDDCDKAAMVQAWAAVRKALNLPDT